MGAVVLVADETVDIASYLFSEEYIRAAKRSGADAIHPGYGFLAENPDFAEAVEAAEIVFVGPTPDGLRAGGDKLEAKRIADLAEVFFLPMATHNTGSLVHTLATAHWARSRTSEFAFGSLASESRAGTASASFNSFSMSIKAICTMGESCFAIACTSPRRATGESENVLIASIAASRTFTFES